MNDSLLRRSQWSPTEKKRSHDLDTEAPEGSYYQHGEEKFAEGYKLARLDRAAKNTITINKIKMILVLNFLPLIGIIYSLFDTRWYLIVETKKYNYWLNFIFIENDCRDNPSYPYCLNPDKIYWTSIFNLYTDDCQYKGLTNDDPINLCSVLTSYYYSGLIAFGIVFFGIMVQVTHITQLIQVIRRGSTNATKLANPHKVPYLIIFLYAGALVYWFFASATPINKNTVENISVFGRFGVSALVYAISVGLFMLLAWWFKRLFSKGVRSSLVEDLLNAEIRYVEELESGDGNDEI